MSERVDVSKIALGGLALLLLGAAVVLAAGQMMSWYDDLRKREITTQQVEILADQLDRMTDGAGGYLKDDQVQDSDSWGTALQVTYSSGEFLNRVTVASAGPDKKFGTGDDITCERRTGSVLNSVKNVTESAAEGAGKGIIKGIKEGIKEGKDKKPEGK